jgi:hypothetical protein
MELGSCNGPRMDQAMRRLRGRESGDQGGGALVYEEVSRSLNQKEIRVSSPG